MKNRFKSLAALLMLTMFLMTSCHNKTGCPGQITDGDVQVEERC